MPPQPFPEVSAASIGAIMAGGRSLRFGSPKGLATIGGTTIVERVIAAQREAFREVVLVADSPDLGADYGVPVISDIHPGAGPLGGLHAALSWANSRGAEGVCCAPWDAPFLDAKLYGILLRLREPTDDAVIPVAAAGSFLEPLFAWYSSRALDVAERCLRQGVFSMHGFVERLSSVRRVPRSALSSIPEPDLLFANVNTREELELARRRSSQPNIRYES